MTNWC